MTTVVKRFVLMGGSIYYASGGFEDYLGSFNTKPEAEAAQAAWHAEKGDMDHYSWSHIGDLETGEYFKKGSACNPTKGF
jgi:hypothetical protein